MNRRALASRLGRLELDRAGFNHACPACGLSAASRFLPVMPEPLKRLVPTPPHVPDPPCPRCGRFTVLRIPPPPFPRGA